MHLAALIAFIIGGEPAPDDRAVVAIAHRAVACVPEPATFTCTGTLIGARVVITAAHCLDGGQPNALAVSFDPVFDPARAGIPVIAGAAHPTLDLAVLILGGDAPSGVLPVPLRRTALPDLAGTDVRILGYGVTSGAGSDTGTRRAGTARVTSIDAGEIVMAPGPAMTCHGDSGGPVIGGGELIGVTASGDPACALTGVAVRVDPVIAFIDSVVAVTQRSFDPAEPSCGVACATDEDCPIETMCFAGACSYRGLPAGDFGATCAADAGCACVALPDGTCREFHPCVVETGATCEPLSAPGTGCCDAGAGSGPLPPIAIVALVAGYLARRRSKAASSSPVAAR